MKTKDLKTKYKLVYRSIEDCDCRHSHDTYQEESFDTLKNALKDVQNECLNDYEASEHSIEKSVSLQIIDEDVVKEYSMALQKFDYKEQIFGDVELLDFDIDFPDDEFEI